MEFPLGNSENSLFLKNSENIFEGILKKIPEVFLEKTNPGEIFEWILGGTS